MSRFNFGFLMRFVLVSVPMLIAIESCSPAGYEILRPKHDSDDGQGIGTPGTPTDPAVNLPPTAGIEVIANGNSVLKVRAGVPVVIRPTVDTLDADDFEKLSCANPGIIQADYDLAGLAKPSVVRAQGCEDLGTPMTFTTPGILKLSLVVTSNEQEKASASMTLIVFDKNVDENLVDGGFRINAYPMIGGTSEEFTFIGLCEVRVGVKKITWTYGDQAAGEGTTVKHVYGKDGQFVVDAVCEANDGRKFTAELTVVVVPSNTPRPPIGTIPVVKPNTGTGTPPPVTNPNQNGNQSDPNQRGGAVVTPKPIEPSVGTNQCGCYYDPYYGWTYYN